MRKVIAFCGNQGSGKGYSCKRLLMTKGFVKTSFANTLRDIAFNVIDIPFEDGMKEYDWMKVNTCIDIETSTSKKCLTFRNILENLGASIRKYDEDFWAKGVIKFIKESTKNVCIDDLRYSNEYRVVKSYCDKNGIEFKLVFCDYHSDVYVGDNPHESAKMARYLKSLGYKDQDYVEEIDIASFELINKIER